MTRSIQEFKGNNAVIGCSATLSWCGTRDCHPAESFFSLNMNRETHPDLLQDITKDLPKGFKNRFQITYVENLDWDAYNLSPLNRRTYNKNGDKGFQNLWDMTTEDGFIFISGCDRHKETRNSIQNLNYVELSRDHTEDYMCVIIPKNQKLTVQEVNEQIKNHHELMSLINNLNKTTYIPAEHEFTFFNIPFAELPSVTSKIQPTYPPTAKEVFFLEKHKTIPEVQELYQALNLLKRLNTEDKVIGGVTYVDRTLPRIGALIRAVDHFFKHETTLIRRDLAIFQRKICRLIDDDPPQAFKDNPDKIAEIKNLVAQLSRIQAQQTNYLELHKNSDKVKALYSAIESLNKVETAPIAQQLAKNLTDLSDTFFKQETSVVNNGIKAFKQEFATLIKRKQPSLIQKNTDYLRVIANILLALTGIGTVAIVVKMYQSHKKSGLYIPLFFEVKQEVVYAHKATIALEKLVSVNPS
ncbi:MAG: hypothetical protein WC627_06070 [Legionella sp.]|jgi:hypothetical protein